MARKKAAKSTQKLNLGCGKTYMMGYINCDKNPDVQADHYFDMENDIWPFEDNSIDEVNCDRVLEFLGDGYFHALKELYRVCKNNALLSISFTHHMHNDFFMDPYHKRPITVQGLQLLSSEFNKWVIDNKKHYPAVAHDLGINFQLQRVVCFSDEAFRKEKEETIQNLSLVNINILAYVKATVQVIK